MESGRDFADEMLALGKNVGNSCCLIGVSRGRHVEHSGQLGGVHDPRPLCYSASLGMC